MSTVTKKSPYSSPNLVDRMFNKDSWYDNLDKPSITPPKFAFPIVWTILYIMIAFSYFNYIAVKKS